MTDSFIQEIRAVREALSKEAGYDAEKIAEGARKRQTESGWKAVMLPPRPVAPINIKKKAR